jgi:hypothetical protein
MDGYLREETRLKTSHHTSTTEDTVYLQDLPTKSISTLRLCANSAFDMEIHTPLFSLTRTSSATLIQIHITVTTSRILYLALRYKEEGVSPQIRVLLMVFPPASWEEIPANIPHIKRSVTPIITYGTDIRICSNLYVRLQNLRYSKSCNCPDTLFPFSYAHRGTDKITVFSVSSLHNYFTFPSCARNISDPYSKRCVQITRAHVLALVPGVTDYSFSDVKNSNFSPS